MKLHVLLTLAVAMSVFAAKAVRADEIIDWNQTALESLRTAVVSPPRAAYDLALVHLAMFDAVNSVSGTYTAYATRVTLPSGPVSQEAAAVAAAHYTLSALYPAQVSIFDQQLATNLASLPNNQATQNGLAVGREAAQNVLNVRQDDGHDAPSSYVPTDEMGHWRPTPPLYKAPELPAWGQTLPWMMDDMKKFLPPPPPALSSAEYAAAVNEVRELGGIDSTTRTADQSEIAIFWIDYPGETAGPPGKFNQIAQVLADKQGNSLEENARLFALINAAMADAGTVAWQAKYQYDMWRPESAIHLADYDTNPLTEGDPDWQPYIVTPAFPAYTSGHSAFGAAAGDIMIKFFGTDDLPFDLEAGFDQLPGVVRHFDTITQAIDENGLSRIYGGVHFSFDNVNSVQAGYEVADYVYDNYARPIPEPLTVTAWLAALAGLAYYQRRRATR